MQQDEMFEIIKKQEILEQEKNDPNVAWGQNLRVLLISDNAPGRASALQHYLSAKTELSSVQYCTNLSETNEALIAALFNAVIFVGLQSDEEIYEAVKKIQGTSRRPFICMYAHIDVIVKNACQKRGIRDIFPDDLPVSQFIKFLQVQIDRVSRNITS